MKIFWRSCSWLAKISYYGVALILILAALYASIGRILVPMVGEYRSELEQSLSEKLQQPVKIARLEGTWRFFSPIFVAHDVSIGQSEQTGIHVDRLELQVKLLPSLLHAAPELKSVRLEGLHLQLQEHDQTWRIQGLMPFAASTTSNTPDFQAVFNALAEIDQLALVNSTLIISAEQAQPLSLTYINLALNNTKQQQLDARLTLNNGEQIELTASAKLDPENWQNSQLQGYFKLPNADWSQWLPAHVLADTGLQQLNAGFQLWYEQDNINQAQGVLQLNAEQLTLNLPNTQSHISQLQSSLFYQRKSSQQQIYIKPLMLKLDEQPLQQPLDFLLRYQAATDGQEQQLELQAKQLQVDDLSRLMQRLVPMPELLEELVTTLDAKGQLHDVQATWYPQREGKNSLQYFMRPVQLNYQAWHGSPALYGINGTIQGDLLSGVLNAKTDKPIGLHLVKLFPKTWWYEQGAVQFKWAVDEDGATLEAPVIYLKGAVGELQGNLNIRLHKDHSIKDTMDLLVNLYNGDARYTEDYLPTLAPHFNPHTAVWLKQAIQEGFVRQGYYKYQGHLVPEPDDTESGSQLFFDVSNAVIDYQTGWPAITDTRAQVHIGHGKVLVEHIDGQILDTKVSDGKVLVDSTGEHNQLSVFAPMLSSVDDVLTILRTAPLDLNREHFKSWTGKGDVPAQLDLQMNLDQPEKIQVKVHFQPRLIDLYMTQYDIALSKVRGDFLFDSSQGLSGRNVQGRFLDSDFKGAVQALGKNGRLASSINVSGTMSINKLRTWLNASNKLPFAGQVPYQLKLTIDPNNVLLTINSSLQGMSSSLPAPFAKTSKETATTNVILDVGQPTKSVRLNYKNNLLNTYLIAPEGDWNKLRGNLRLADGVAPKPTRAGLYVQGKLSELDVDSWQVSLDKMQTGDLTQNSPLKQLDIAIAKVRAFDRTFNNVLLRAEGKPQGLWLNINNVDVEGQIQLSNRNQPIDIYLKQYHLEPSLQSKAVSTNPPEDVLAGMNPAAIPAFNLRIDQLFLADSSRISQLQLNARPYKNGVQFSDLQVDLKGMMLAGVLTWQGQGKGAQTHFSGTLSGADVGAVLKRWGYAESVTSDKFSAALTGNWAGSPQAFALENYSGALDARFTNGMIKHVEGSAQALRVFGLLNFDSIGRRLRLDFRDVFSKGLAYDKAKISMQVQQGRYVTKSPVTITGPASDLALDGTLNLRTNQINARLSVTLPVSNNLSIAAIIAGAPAIGGAIFVVDKIIGDKFSSVATVNYTVTGDWENPDIKPELLNKDKKIR